MQFINDADTEGLAYEPFVLLGILANCMFQIYARFDVSTCLWTSADLRDLIDNKFEFQNPYQLRLDDFVNESTIKRIIQEVGVTSIQCRGDYVILHDDLPEGWSLNNMLSYVGLKMLSGGKPKSPPPTASKGDISKLNFSNLPNGKAAILLATYDFVNANKLFCFNFVNYQDADPTGRMREFVALTAS